MHGLLLVFSLNGVPHLPPGDRWFGADKAQHFFTSAFVQGMTYGSLRAAGVSHGVALAGATATTIAVGVGKEVLDKRVKGEFSLRDLTWDAAGAGTMTVLLVRVQR
jgi:putative lipoprotein